VVVPDLFWLEIGSFLWKAAKRGTLTSVLAQRALEAMLNRDFPLCRAALFCRKRSRSPAILTDHLRQHLRCDGRSHG